MRALSFRFKLLLAMMLLVAAVTGAVLVVTQRRVEATYQNLFRGQFAEQIRLFSQMREFRLSTVTEQCRALGKSVRMQEALREGDAEDIYQNARHELKLIVEAAASGSNRFAARLLCFLDANGRMLKFNEEFEQLNSRLNVKGLVPSLETIGKALKDPSVQQVGYVAMDNAEGNRELLEIVVTKILDASVNDELRGALVLGFPLSELTDSAPIDADQIKSGFFVGGRFFSRAISTAANQALVTRLSEVIGKMNQPGAQLGLEIAGEPHQIFNRALDAGRIFPTAYQVGFYSLKNSLREQAQLRRAIISFGGLALLGGLLAGLVLTGRLTSAIRELAAGTLEIQKGNFQVSVPVRSRDEIGRLTQSFNEMAQGLVEREKYRGFLNQVADKEVAHAMIHGGVALGGETREISVLFCDIRGFTALTQNMDPAEVITMLNEHMTELTRVVYEHHGVVDKFVGDLIMAIFGAPKSYDHDARNAVACAWEMIQRRARLNQTSRYQIEVGIGVATGKAVAGCMGSQDRLNYTVLGERVNLASRLCSKAGRMEVVIDQTSNEKLAGQIEVSALAPLQLKGFSEPVPAFKLAALKQAVDIS
ncbi:MAG: adenylate/guanylate cyclase domain-containing protein [Verrucomicrobia bacterium]|nr:adenylate/guanylate cyclase domain-containing protein [Verrucomicrobiota bacterium]